MSAHLAFHVGEFAFALRQCQKALEKATASEQQEDLLTIATLSMRNLDTTGKSTTLFQPQRLSTFPYRVHHTSTFPQYTVAWEDPSALHQQG